MSYSHTEFKLMREVGTCKGVMDSENFLVSVDKKKSNPAEEDIV